MKLTFWSIVAGLLGYTVEGLTIGSVRYNDPLRPIDWIWVVPLLIAVCSAVCLVSLQLLRCMLTPAYEWRDRYLNDHR